MLFGRKLFTILFGALVLPLAAHSAVMIEVKFEGQPQMLLGPDGRPNTCGVRVFGVKPPEIGNTFIGVDGSFLVSVEGDSGFGMVKGLLYEIDAKGMKSNARPVPQKIEMFWFRAGGGGATQPRDGKVFDSPETKGAKLYPTNLGSVLSLWDSLLDGQPIQIGVGRKRGNVDFIFYGKVTISGSDFSQLSECFQEMTQHLQGK